jgi:hypothetical protein
MQTKPETIRKLREALAQANAHGESQEQVIADLVRIAKSLPGGVDALISMYREVVRENRSDLGSAIEKALFQPSDSTPTLPAQTGDVTKAVQENTVEGAIASAFGRRSTPTRKTITSIPSADGPRHGRLSGGKK